MGAGHVMIAHSLLYQHWLLFLSGPERVLATRCHSSRSSVHVLECARASPPAPDLLQDPTVHGRDGAAQACGSYQSHAVEQMRTLHQQTNKQITTPTLPAIGLMAEALIIQQALAPLGTANPVTETRCESRLHLQRQSQRSFQIQRGRTSRTGTITSCRAWFDRVLQVK
jgi:hypothetical protein